MAGYVIDLVGGCSYAMTRLHTIVETAGFLRDAETERMSAASRVSLKNALATNPESGDLVVGSGGIRKLRLAGRGKGKSGGYRVLTAYLGANLPVYLLAVLSKADRETFSDAEIAQFAKLIASIKGSGQSRHGPAA